MARVWRHCAAAREFTSRCVLLSKARTKEDESPDIRANGLADDDPDKEAANKADTMADMFSRGAFK